MPEALEPPPDAATPLPWVCWGDSLSYHQCNSSPTNTDVYYTPDGSRSFMQTASDQWLGGTPIINRGVGSETSTEIALRQGAHKAILTVENNTIPASGSVDVTLNAPSGDFLVFTVHGTLNGVPGVLKRHMVGPGYWTFTRSEPGNPVYVAPQTPFHIPQGDDGVRDLPAIFWVGRNNPDNIDVIKRDIAAMVANRDQSQPYYVVSLTPGFQEWNSTVRGQKRAALNDYLAATYGEHFIDVEAYLQDKALFEAGIYPTVADRTAQTYGGNPRSLWAAADDEVHFNYLARSLIASHIARVIAQPNNQSLRSYDPWGDMLAQVDSSGMITTLGWAIDPSDYYAGIRVDVTVNGQLVKSEVSASLPSDYLYAYGVPGKHAFVTQWRASSAGTHEVCVTARNIFHGSSQSIGCKTVNVASLPAPQIDPQGDMYVEDAGGGVIRVLGWAFDHSNYYAQIPVRVTVNGKVAATATANLPSDYLYSYGIPGQHAFFSGVWADNGTNVVCVTAVNTGPGTDTEIGCRTLTIHVPPQDPMGDVQFGMNSTGQILVNGWAVDMSEPMSPVTVIVTMNDFIRGYFTANQPRNDLMAYGIPGYHGFSGSLVPSVSGTIKVCAYAANLGPRGSMQQLGCSTMSTANHLPTGAVTLQRLPNGLNAAGWVIDFSAPQQPVTISVYVNNRLIFAGEAGLRRDELTQLYGWPPNHGFDASVALGPGTYRVQVVAVNIGVGSTASLYSGTITI